MSGTDVQQQTACFLQRRRDALHARLRRRVSHACGSTPRSANLDRSRGPASLVLEPARPAAARRFSGGHSTVSAEWLALSAVPRELFRAHLGHGGRVSPLFLAPYVQGFASVPVR